MLQHIWTMKPLSRTSVKDIDYNEIKDKLPDPNEGDPYQVQTALDAIQTEGDPVGGDVIE